MPLINSELARRLKVRTPVGCRDACLSSLCSVHGCKQLSLFDLQDLEGLARPAPALFCCCVGWSILTEAASLGMVALIKGITDKVTYNCSSPEKTCVNRLAKFADERLPAGRQLERSWKAAAVLLGLRTSAPASLAVQTPCTGVIYAAMQRYSRMRVPSQAASGFPLQPVRWRSWCHDDSGRQRSISGFCYNACNAQHGGPCNSDHDDHSEILSIANLIHSASFLPFALFPSQPSSRAWLLLSSDMHREDLYNQLPLENILLMSSHSPSNGMQSYWMSFWMAALRTGCFTAACC